MLLQICDYICRERMVSNQQLSREFRLELSALQPILDLAVRKGIIRKSKEQSNCSARCFKCKSSAAEYYFSV